MATAPIHPLARTDHRPWPVPAGPWIMEQIWRDLLFAHWAIPAAVVRPLIPKELTLDTFDGQAWVSVTPFHMSIRPRGSPLAWMRAVPELNCRTYVTAENKPGVYFFSLDIRSYAAVAGARLAFHLPYHHAWMRIRHEGNAIAYSARRGALAWSATYAPEGPAREAEPGSVEHWLCERYCLYTVRGRRVYRGDIHHVPWPLQNASAKIAENGIARNIVSNLPDQAAIVSFAGSCAF